MREQLDLIDITLPLSTARSCETLLWASGLTITEANWEEDARHIYIAVAPNKIVETQARIATIASGIASTKVCSSNWISAPLR